jgi:hypothetical protein
VADLQHLESLVDKAGSSLVVVFFYTRSCGVCKELLKDFAQLCEEVRLWVWLCGVLGCFDASGAGRARATWAPGQQRQQRTTHVRYARAPCRRTCSPRVQLQHAGQAAAGARRVCAAQPHRRL